MRSASGMPICFVRLSSQAVVVCSRVESRLVVVQSQRMILFVVVVVAISPRTGRTNLSILPPISTSSSMRIQLDSFILFVEDTKYNCSTLCTANGHGSTDSDADHQRRSCPCPELGARRTASSTTCRRSTTRLQHFAHPGHPAGKVPAARDWHARR